MKLSQFKFAFDESLIAKYPAHNRHDAKMMVINRAKKKIEHKKFADILKMFTDRDVIVVNNTKVFPARLYGNKEKTGATIEVFLLRELNKEHKLWDVLVDPARKIRVGNKLYFGNDDLVAEVVDNTTSRGRTIRFLFDGSDEELWSLIEKLGEMPIPKYMNRPVEKIDADRYNTIFAKKIGAVIPPTGAMHFSRELAMRLEIKGVRFAEVTLHNSMGAYKEVEVEDLTKHKMDSEYYEVPAETSEIVNNAKTEKRKIVAAGVSTLRALESAVSSMDTLNPLSGWTDKFLFPPHDFKIANCLITNFHRPESTMLMATAAFAGFELLEEAYKQAIEHKYQFLAYGDAMLII
ncbi:MAG: tRNA preQ1(34) S-adenosylmethionine ribosyltransferase-isomerase QueA [Bacteroidia bacterium]